MKNKVKRILAVSCSSVLLAGIIFGNIEAYVHAEEISSHLCPAEEIIDVEKTEEANNEGDAVVQALCDEGITLMKNINNTLPLTVNKETKYKVNLFGLGSTDIIGNNDQNGGFFYTGTGSGGNQPRQSKLITLQKGLEEAGFEVNSELLNAYKNNKDNFEENWYNDSNDVLKNAKEFHNNGESSTAIVTISRMTGENMGAVELTTDTTLNTTTNCKYRDRDSDGRTQLQLSLKEEYMLNYVKENFDKVIVLINSGNTMELGYMDDPNIDALLYVAHPGQSGTKSIGRILSGEVNPSGHLVDTFVYDSKQDPTWANVIMNNTNGKQINYAEDIYFGYKWYETADKEGYFTSKGTAYDKVVQFPFGYGLSYTDFEWKITNTSWTIDGITENIEPAATFTNENTTINIEVEVKNVGDKAGKDVVECYYTAPYYQGGIEKSYVNLVSFAKTDIIKPGETDKVTISFDLYDMASYDCYDKNKNGYTGWELEPGEYHIKLMESAHTVKKNANNEDLDIVFNVKNMGTSTSAMGYTYFFDPVTSNPVYNRFTGEYAENGIAIDGNNNGTKIEYLSRANFASTFPVTETPARTTGANACSKTGYYGWEEEGLVAPRLNNNSSHLYLWTREDGSKASLEDLERTSGNTIVPNDELIMELGADYDNEKWGELLSQLSMYDIDYIVSTAGYGTKARDSIGLPTLLVHDGPSGFNRSMTTGDGKAYYFTSFPCEVIVAMTWNTDLARQEGSAIGSEAMATGESGIYAPTVNLHRTAYNTRNFEAYSEDGVISGYMAAAMIHGAQTHGAQVSLKHFALSEAGNNPNHVNTWLTEQNFRENYLKAFEIAVKKGKSNFIMSAFNNIGGVRARFSYELLTGILRDEWGFQGSVVTDYDSELGNSRSLVRAGNDLKLNPNKTTGDFDENNVGDIYYGVQAVKNSLFTYCNTYYLTKSYNPTIEFTMVQRTKPFQWWIPCIVAVDVVSVAGLSLWVFLAFKPKKKVEKKEK